MDKPAFNFTSAAFFFFKALGRRPGAVLWIALWQIILYAVIYGGALALLWPFWAELFGALAEGVEPDEATILRYAASLFAGAMLAGIGGLLALVLAQGAWLRLLTRDEVAGGIPFRLGGDELRLIGVNILFILLNMVFWGVAIGVAVAPTIAAQAAGGDTGAVLGGAAVSSLVVVAAVVIWIILALKLAAAPAMSVQQRRFRFFGSFAATNSITAWMLLVYLLACVIYVGGAIVVSLAQQVAVLLAAADLIGALSALDPEADPEIVFSILADIFTRPSALIGLGVVVLLQILFQILFEAFWHGPGAYVAVRHANDPLSHEETFSAPAGSVGDAPAEG
ncbi:hypothetical protein ACWCOP_05600 [Maricaulaceae bacterium MS644]